MTHPTNNAPPEYDPLASFDKVPAVSFTTDGGFPQNTWRTFIVTGYMDLVQATDDDGKPKVYEDTGKPVMKAVLPVEDEEGEARNIWMKKNNVEGGLMRGFRLAQAELGSRIGPGTKVAIKWWNDTTKPKKLGNHPKAYEVKATAGDTPPPAVDPLNESATPPATGNPFGGPATTTEPPF